jgi:hypothetical protein
MTDSATQFRKLFGREDIKRCVLPLFWISDKRRVFCKPTRIRADNRKARDTKFAFCMVVWQHISDDHITWLVPPCKSDVAYKLHPTLA